MDKSRVLFLCTGNSCRSQMAEAIVNARMGDRWEAYSAGSRPSSDVHPLAMKVLGEIGIEHNGRTKSMDEFLGHQFELVVTLCSEDEGECPVWLGKGRIFHKPFPDPTKVTGSEADRLVVFRQVRDAIAAEITRLLA